MKTLFITDLYPIKSDESKTPLTLHNFVSQWIKQGHKVEVIKPNFIFNSFLRGKSFYKEDFYVYEGVRIFNVNYLTPFCFNFLKKIPKEIDLNSYDIVIAHMPSGIIFANKLIKIIPKPLICGVHMSDIEVLTNSLYKFYFQKQMKEAYKNATKIACRSFVLQKKFNEIMPEFAQKTFVAASGIRPQDCFNKKTPFTTFNSPLTVLTCANLIKRKNIDKLILAIKDMADFKLKVIGDGPELKHLKRISSENISFLSRLSNEKVLEQMRKADIFILPSVNETFGMVYLEAMASGCVTVCTKNDGIDGIIKDSKNGFLCEATPESIKETLIRIKNFENIENILKNSQSTLENYTQEICAKNYLEY